MTESTEAIRKTQKKYGSGALVIAIVIGFVLILCGYKAVGKGLIAGALFSVINFVLMGESLYLKIRKERASAMGISFILILVRYAVMAIPLIVALKFEKWNVFAVMVGLFLVQLYILADHMIYRYIIKRV